jgi:hypothetical protein
MKHFALASYASWDHFYVGGGRCTRKRRRPEQVGELERVAPWEERIVLYESESGRYQ